jgi:hypothetical protein
VSAPDGRTSVRPYLLATAVLFALKLWLIHPDEVVAVQGTFDQLRYTEMADHLWEGRWLGPYDQRTLIRGPAFPAFMVLARTFGVPLRLFSEIALLASAAAFGLVALRAGARWPGAVLAVAFLVLCPHSYPINNEALSEALYTPALILAVAASALSLVAGGRARVVSEAACGASLAVLWHTRPEGHLVLALVLSIVLVSVVWGPRDPRRAWWARGLRAAILPALAIVLSTAALGLANRAAYGVFTDNELLHGGFQAAHHALLRIEAPPRLFVAIPESSRRLAYGVSPSFRQLEPFLEGQLKANLAAAGCTQFEVCDDIANGWLLFAVRDAAFLAGAHRDAATADAFYRAVARDIHEACDAGRFACRSRYALPYVSAARASHLPRSIRDLVSSMTSPAGSGKATTDPPEIDAGVRGVFDRTALRRSALLESGTFEVSGWIFGDGGVPVLRVSLEDAAGGLLGDTRALTARPDVVEYFRQRGTQAPARTGFRVSGMLPPGEARLRAARLVLTLADGQTRVSPLQEDGNAPDGLHRGLEVVREKVGFRHRVHALRGAIEPAYHTGLRLALGLAIGVSVWRAWKGRTRVLPSPLAGLVILSLAVVTERILYFAAVNVFLFGSAPRYLYPVIGLCGAALGLAAAGGRREPVGNGSPAR